MRKVKEDMIANGRFLSINEKKKTNSSSRHSRGDETRKEPEAVLIRGLQEKVTPGK